MNKKLREPTNPQNLLWFFALLGCSHLCLFFVLPNSNFDGLIFMEGFFALIFSLWTVLRMHLFGTHHHVLSFILGAIFFFISLFLASDYLFNSLPTTMLLGVSADYGTLVFYGLIGSSFAELMSFFINKSYQLQRQGLEKLALGQEMTVKEVAAIALMSEKKVHRALGYQTIVPANAAREWLEGVKGIRCPPAKKALV